MHTLAAIAKTLNRPVVYLRGLQERFELPSFGGAGYPAAWLNCVRTIVYLRILNIPEETLRELWHLEKKLLQLLHMDTTGSPTWFLDACGQKSHPDRRLLLTNCHLGTSLRAAAAVQPGLNFSPRAPEFFPSTAMGEDALAVLRDCLKIHVRIHSDITAELPVVRAAAR